MADILTTIKLQADQYLAEGKKVEEQMRGISSAEKKAGEDGKTAFAGASKGAQQATQNLKEVGKQAESTSQLFSKLGGVIVAAFSVGQIIAFGKQTVHSFQESEKAATQLKAALETVSSEGVSAFKKLTAQATQLQKISIFSDEQIKQTQTALLNFGLTSRQVETLTARIVDFASRTGKSIEESTGIFERAIEGQQRGLVDSGAKFEDTGSKVGNFNALLQATEKFAGGAAVALKTSAGEIQNIGNQIDDVNEETGKALAPLALTFAKIELFGVRLAKVFTSDSFTRVQKLKELFFGSDEPSELPKELNAVANAVDAIAEKRERILKASLSKSVTGFTDAELKAEIKRLGTLDEANTILVKDRIALLSKELEARNKNKGKVLEDAQKEIAERQQANEALRKFTNDELNKNADLQSANQKLIASETISDENKLQAELLRIDEETTKQKIQNAKDTLQPIEALEIELTNIHIKQNELKKKSDKEFSDNALKLIQDDVKRAIEAEDIRLKSVEDAEKKKQDLIKQTFDVASELSATLQQLLSTQDQAALDSIATRKDAQLEADDEELAKLEEKHNKRKLSDKQYEKAKADLLAKRKADEKAFAAEEKKLRREQAERDKAFAIFNATIKLAEAIVAASTAGPGVGLVLAALTAALMGAQLAAIIATPIPEFAKGTKGKKEKGMGIVGEKGAEFMFMPQGTKVVPADRTKKHSRLVDAMIDDRVEDLVYYDYVLPALQAAAKKKEQASSKTFADNMRDSFTAPQSALNFYDLVEGLGKNNGPAAEAMGAAIAKYLNQGYSNPRYH